VTTTRLEAFSDGVIAILITIMVLELRPPAGDTVAALFEGHLRAKFAAYVLSFIYLGIYWNNHHHLLHVVDRVDGRIMWANLHLLFWLSVVPFTTAWMGEHAGQSHPAALYGASLMMAGVAYWILVRAIIAEELEQSGGRHSKLLAAVGKDVKGVSSIVIYALGIAVSVVAPWISYALYWGVAIIWLIPDRRMTKQIQN
jgi:uncharacterized membrane protein